MGPPPFLTVVRPLGFPIGHLQAIAAPKGDSTPLVFKISLLGAPFSGFLTGYSGLLGFTGVLVDAVYLFFCYN